MKDNWKDVAVHGRIILKLLTDIGWDAVDWIHLT
jgi:hypothetical protein